MLCNLKIKQECIPEGCLPPAAVAVTGGGGVGLDQIPLNFHLGCGPGDPPPSRSDPPKLPPWVWVWKPARHAGTRPPPRTRHPPRTRYTSRTRHPPWPGTPLGPGTPPDQAHAPPVNRITDTCKNITLPQNLFVGGN